MLKSIELHTKREKLNLYVWQVKKWKVGEFKVENNKKVAFFIPALAFQLSFLEETTVTSFLCVFPLESESISHLVMSDSLQPHGI